MYPDKLDGKLYSATAYISPLKLPFFSANLYYFCQYILCIPRILLKPYCNLLKKENNRKTSKISILWKGNLIGKFWYGREFPSLEKRFSLEKFEAVGNFHPWKRESHRKFLNGWEFPFYFHGECRTYFPSPWLFGPAPFNLADGIPSILITV